VLSGAVPAPAGVRLEDEGLGVGRLADHLGHPGPDLAERPERVELAEPEVGLAHERESAGEAARQAVRGASQALRRAKGCHHRGASMLRVSNLL
jgi:hypothetical protein